MDEALLGLTEEVLQFGTHASPRGLGTREVLASTFRLTNPRARRVHLPARRWSPAFAVGELCWHWAGSDDVEFIASYASRWRSFSDDGTRISGSSYGAKIFSPRQAGASQWENLIRVLREDPSSRRAVIGLYEAPASVTPEEKDLACLTSLQFLVRGGLLHCVTTARSNDLILGVPYDVFFATMLQERLATELQVGLGWYQHNAASLHVYEEHFDMAEAIVRGGPSEVAEPMSPMGDLQAIPAFLRAEAALRTGDEGAPALVGALPPYWRDLAEPLLRRYLRRRKV